MCYTRKWSAPYHVRNFTNYFTRIRAKQYYQDYSLHDRVAVTVSSLLRNELQKPGSKTKRRKNHELGHFFFFPSPTTSGSREAGRKSLIHLGRSESGVNPCENNAEGWIMMIVETTYRSVVRVPRLCGWAVSQMYCTPKRDP